MAFVVADRVKETTTTTGTGAVALAGAVTGFRTFASGIGNSNTTYYTIASQTANEWEVGYGTLDATSANLARTTVLASSNGGSLVTFSAGTKDVFVTQSAARTLVQASGGTTTNGVLYYTGSGVATGGSALTFDGSTFNTTGNITLNGSQVLAASNYNSYAPTLTGTGASGTWGISITGNAATATSATSASTLFGSSNLYISPTNANTLNSGYGTAADGPDIWLNYRGYNDGFSYFRNFNVGNGKGTAYVWGDGANQRLGVAKGQAASYTLDVNGIIYTNTSARAPIFYDADDTGYYVNPNSTSALNTLIVPVGIGAYDSSVGNDPYGKISVTRDAAANYSYYGLTRAGQLGAGMGIDTSNQIWFGSTSSGYNGTRISTYFYMNTSGDTWSPSSSRAPIFYDSDNTAYYVNPYGTSVLYNAVLTNNAGGLVVLNGNPADTINAATWYGIGGSNVLGYGSYSYMVQVAGYYGLRLRSSSSILDLDGASYGGGWAWLNTNLAVVGQSRGASFYDTDDSGYYLDLNSTSNSALRIRGGALHGPNPTWGKYLYVGTDGNPGTGNSSVCVTNGNLHIDAENGYVMYLNNYSTSSYTLAAQSMRSPIFYDSDDTGYYVNPNSTSVLNVAALYGQISSYKNDTQTILASYNTSAGSPTQLGIYHSYSNVVIQNYRGDLFLYGGQVTTDNSYRAPIFYDSNNTTYYADLSSTGTSIQAAGNITAYYSDERLKTKLGKIENAVDKVMMLEGFYYEANETAQKLGYKPKREVGVSAQDVQRVLPEIVAQAPISAEYLTIDYERLTPLLIEAIKELKAEIEALKK